ncbi:MAG: FxDxF family PEP-CTERM protein [Sphingomonadaceae bacterium]
MFKKLTLAAATAAAFAVASPASAALTLIPSPATCTVTDSVCNWIVAGSTSTGSFSQSATFSLPQVGTTGSSITNSATKVDVSTYAGNIDFSRIFLTDPNGAIYDFSLTPTGLVETGSILMQTIAGTYTLTVEGSANTAATYGGNITFSAVPEPATWALMILGFGAVGFSMRRRSAAVRTTRATLKFA